MLDKKKTVVDHLNDMELELAEEADILAEITAPVLTEKQRIERLELVVTRMAELVDQLLTGRKKSN
jgi:hypothetical protein